MALAIGLIWVYSFAVQGQPLRTLRFDRGSGFGPLAFVAPDGKTALLSDALLHSDLENPTYCQRIVDLTSESELVSPAVIGNASVRFVDGGRFARLSATESEAVRVIDLRSGQFLDPVPEEFVKRPATTSDQTGSTDGRWEAKERNRYYAGRGLIEQCLGDYLELHLRPQSWFEIKEQATGSVKRVVSGQDWAGYVLPNRCWTSELLGDRDDVAIYEWEIIQRRWLDLWFRLLGAVAAGVVIYDWRRPRPAAPFHRP